METAAFLCGLGVFAVNSRLTRDSLDITMGIMEILLTPLRAMGVFISNPILVLVPTIVLLGLFAVSRRFSVLLAGLLWLAYLPYEYEYAMKLRILCSGECNIRVDLLLIYPVLLVVSIMAIIAFMNFYRKGRDV